MLSLSSSANAAAVVHEYGKPFGEQDMGALVEGLAASIKQVQGGNMKRCEAILMGQAHALQSIFMNLSRRALAQEYQKNFESFFRMALKAQNQCRMTLETLANIKNPPVVFAKQANVTTGPQQINNGTVAQTRTREIENSQTKLTGASHELLPDASTPGNESRIHPALETLGEVDRAKVTRREGEGFPERL